MSTVTRKPPRKETVGAQYICFNTPTEDDSWSGAYETEVEKTEVVKSVKVTENSESNEVYASGKIYDSDNNISKTDIEVNVIAYPVDTLARMRGEVVDVGGLHMSGGKGTRPYFGYGKVVYLENGNVRYEWYPKCKLASNSDEIATKEASPSEQTDTITISAYPFNDNEDNKVYVDSSASNFPKGLTEDVFFEKPILTPADLATAISKAIAAGTSHEE